MGGDPLQGNEEWSELPIQFRNQDDRVWCFGRLEQNMDFRDHLVNGVRGEPHAWG